jgi:hypothetical protein
MPTTRRKRANSPEQPENAQAAAEQRAQESNPETPNASAGGTVSSTEHPEQSATTETKEASSQEPTTTAPSEQEAPQRTTKSEEHPQNALAPANYQHPALFPPVYPQQNTFNGERQTREYHPHVEGGRRAPFRRQPQNITPPAPVPTTPPAASANLQPPSHEIKLPLGNKLGDTTGDTLHLAYNPGYTKADEVRAELLKQLVEESKTGGRARCWNCGSLAIVYDSWNTKNKTFGEIGIAYCEICGVWSVM